jgi:hypothetical protein
MRYCIDYVQSFDLLQKISLESSSQDLWVKQNKVRETKRNNTRKITTIMIFKCTRNYNLPTHRSWPKFIIFLPPFVHFLVGKFQILCHPEKIHLHSIALKPFNNIKSWKLNIKHNMFLFFVTRILFRSFWVKVQCSTKHVDG